MQHSAQKHIDPKELVVHRAPMLLLDSILEANEEKCIALVEVDPTAWYAESDGSMPGWFGIELMAQTVAAYSGAGKLAIGHAPRVGFLLGTQHYTSHMAKFPAGAKLEVEAKIQYLDETGLSAFGCEIRHFGHSVAHATLKTFEPR